MEIRKEASMPPLLLPFLGFSFTILLFVFLCPYSSLRTPIFISAGVIPAAVIFSLLFRFSSRFLTGVALGAFCTLFFLVFLLVPAEKAEGKAFFSVRVSEYAKQGSFCGQAEVTLLSRNGKKMQPLRAVLYLDDATPDNIIPGDLLILTANAKPTSSPYNTGEGIFLTLTQKGDITRIEKGADTFYCRLRRFAASVSHRIQTLLPAREGALLSALLCGDTDSLDRDFKNALRASGLSHMVSVSGMHTSILIMLICAVPGKRAGIYISLPVLAIYAAMTGFSPSVLRAVLMNAVFSASFILRRQYDPLSSLMCAALALCCGNPFVIISPSFALSFAGTLGIILFSSSCLHAVEPLLPHRKLLHGITRRVVSLLSVTFSATVLTLPVSMLFFKTVSLAGLFSNLLAVWAVAPAMIAGILLLPLAALFPFLAVILSLPLRHIIGAVFLSGRTIMLTSETSSTYLLILMICLLCSLILFRAGKLPFPITAFVSIVSAVAFTLCTVCENLMCMKLYLWGRDGYSCAVVYDNGAVFALNAPSGAGAFLTESFAARGSNSCEALVTAKESYALSAAAQYVNAPIYSGCGGLYFDHCYVELLSGGAAFVLAGSLSLWDISAAKPYDCELPETRADILLISPAWANTPHLLSALCSQVRPSLVLLSGSQFFECPPLEEACGCEVVDIHASPLKIICQK